MLRHPWRNGNAPAPDTQGPGFDSWRVSIFSIIIIYYYYLFRYYIIILFIIIINLLIILIYILLYN